MCAFTLCSCVCLCAYIIQLQLFFLFFLLLFNHFKCSRSRLSKWQLIYNVYMYIYKKTLFVCFELTLCFKFCLQKRIKKEERNEEKERPSQRERGENIKLFFLIFKLQKPLYSQMHIYAHKSFTFISNWSQFSLYFCHFCCNGLLF